MFLRKPLAVEHSSLPKALSYFTQVIGGLGSFLQAGLGGTCIVHIIAGILCFLDNSQQEIPGTNLSTVFFPYYYYLKKKKRKKESETKSHRTKKPILTPNHRYVRFGASFADFIFSSEGFMTSHSLFL